MRYTFILFTCLFSFLLSLSFAGEHAKGSDGAALDYNFGIIGRLDISGNGAEFTRPGGGPATSFEFLSTGLIHEKNHIAFIDSNLRVNLGITTHDNVNFLLNLKGNLTGGVQIFGFFPLTLSIEDAELTMHGAELEGSSLVGIAHLIPIGDVFDVNTDTRQLIFTTTMGSRRNNTVMKNYKDSFAAVQFRVRFLDSFKPDNHNDIDYSAFSSFLFDVGSTDSIDEKKVAAGFAVNNFIYKDSHFGVEGSHTNFKLDDNQKEATSILFFIGGDIF